MVRATHLTIQPTTCTVNGQDTLLPPFTLLHCPTLVHATEDNEEKNEEKSVVQILMEKTDPRHMTWEWKSGSLSLEDVQKLHFDRYVKNRRCAVYSRIPFSELEHARMLNHQSTIPAHASGNGDDADAGNDAVKKAGEEVLMGHVYKGQKLALLEDLDHGAWFHVVFDVDVEKVSGDTSAPICHRGYVLSYLTGKMHNIESIQLKPVASTPHSTTSTDEDHYHHAVDGNEADVSESSATNVIKPRRRQRAHRRKKQAASSNGNGKNASEQGDGGNNVAGSTFRARKFEGLVSNMRTTYDSDINTYQFQFPSIGIFHSCFPEKNGTPRQGNLSPFSKGKLVITIPNARQSIEGLEEYSHVWLVFVFHMNTATRYQYNHPKVKPPRLDSGKVGVFSTRSPHRPNPIGLTAARIDRIVRDTIYLSGVDLVSGTPILDIKPYIPHYDSFGHSQINVNNNLEQERYFGRRIIDSDVVDMPDWIKQAPEERIQSDNISFEDDALKSLERLVPKLEYFSDLEEIKLAIIQVIRTDPRPSFMKGKNRRVYKLYGFRIDNINVRCIIQEDGKVVVKVIERWLD